jgi:hypothetical protein
MLTMLSLGPDAVPVKDINAHLLNRRVRKGLGPTQAALLAYELEVGTARLREIPRREACRLTGASVGYVATIAKASPEERAAILRGDLPVTRLHNKPKALPTDDELDRLVAMIGADRIMAALDRYTQPTTTV